MGGLVGWAGAGALVVPDTSAAVAAQPAGMRKSAIKRPGQGGNAPNERELVVMEPEYKFTPPSVSIFLRVGIGGGASCHRPRFPPAGCQVPQTSQSAVSPPAFKKHLWNVLIGSQLPSGPKARLYTSLGPSPQVSGPTNNQGLKARSNPQSPVRGTFLPASAPQGIPALRLCVKKTVPRYSAPSPLPRIWVLIKIPAKI